MTSWSEVSTPAELSIASVSIRAAGQRVGDAPALSDAEIGALADHLSPDFVAVDAQRVIGAVTDFRVALVGRLDKGADAAEPQQVNRRGKEFADQFGWRQAVGLDSEQAASSAD